MKQKLIKSISILLVLVMTLSYVTACANPNSNTDTNQATGTGTTTQQGTNVVTDTQLDTLPNTSITDILTSVTDTISTENTSSETPTIETVATESIVTEPTTENNTTETLAPETTITETEDTEIDITDITTEATENSDLTTDDITESATENITTTDITESEFNSDVGASTSAPTEAPSETESEAITETQTEAPEELDLITVFANGAYSAEFIRAERPDTLDKEIYEEIRALFKDRVSVNPKLKTDFVAYGKEPYDGPAILIGQTNYPESQEAYKKLKDGEASATLVGNKYVIVFTSNYAAEKLLTTLKTNLKKKATPTEVKITAEWDIKTKVDYITSGDETFDEEGLINSATLPNLGTSYESSSGTRVCITKNATKTTYTSLCKSLEDAKLKKYTSTSIGNNLFSTYITQTQIVHVMFFPNTKEIRTAVDKRGTGTNGFTLPGLSGDNKYIPTETSLMTLVDIENSCWPGGMCLIFKLCDGRFVVVDSGVGGRDNDGSSSGWLYQSLKKHAKDPKNIEVAAWIITHIHSDHAGGLVDMARGTYNTTLKKDGEQVRTHNVMPHEAKNWIKIDTIIYNQPKKNVDGRDGWMNEIINAFKVKNVIKAHPGQVFYYANCKITMYGSLDLVVEKTISNHNDESLSMMFEFNGKKFLVLGDAYPQNTKALATIYKENLKADIVQTSHHGYDNTDAAQVYEYVQATMVMWPVAGYEKDQCDLVNAKVNAIFKSIPSTMQFTPRGQNIDFNDKWKVSAKYSLMSAIPYCDCNACKSGTPIRSSGN